MNSNFDINWVDLHREPQCAPNPAYPDGLDIDATSAGTKTCHTALPYPAKRCGYYVIECKTCGLRVAVTTAGRPDDPRSITLACLSPGSAPKPKQSER